MRSLEKTILKRENKYPEFEIFNFGTPIGPKHGSVVKRGKFAELKM